MPPPTVATSRPGSRIATWSPSAVRYAVPWAIELVPTMPTSYRPFQGWRYLDGGDAPKDLAKAGKGAAKMPPKMLAELRELGLL